VDNRTLSAFKRVGLLLLEMKQPVWRLVGEPWPFSPLEESSVWDGGGKC
jgi:hypothetical protein